MKIKPSSFVLSLVLFAACFTGCAIFQKAYTPVVTSTETTNGVVVWQTNYVANPAVTEPLKAIGDIGIPYASPIANILLLLYGVGVSLANKKNKDAAAVLAENIDTAREVIKDLSPSKATHRAMGVATPEEKFVEKIADKQNAAGVRATVRKLRA